jgi:hypothetical protein
MILLQPIARSPGNEDPRVQAVRDLFTELDQAISRAGLGRDASREEIRQAMMQGGAAESLDQPIIPRATTEAGLKSPEKTQPKGMEFNPYDKDTWEKYKNMAREHLEKTGRHLAIRWEERKYTSDELAGREALPSSRVWEDGEVTDQIMEGTAAMDAKHLERLINMWGMQTSYSGRPYLIDGKLIETGVDPGEVVLKDARIIRPLDTIDVDGTQRPRTNSNGKPRLSGPAAPSALDRDICQYLKAYMSGDALEAECMAWVYWGGTP